MPFPFNVRVYGVLIEQNRLLVTDEVIAGMEYTKLPGGGLEFGEGTIECVKREFIEETGIAVDVVKHLYTTDYFVKSAFNPDDQVISVYYQVSSKETNKLPLIRNERFQFMGEQQVFRWIPLEELRESDFDLPIDKKIVAILHNL